METGERAGPDDLTHFDALSKQPETYHLFHALRVIEAKYAEYPRLGESIRPRQDRVRLGQEAELAFPPSTIAGFTPPQGDAPGRLTNRAFGLFGPQGPLPIHITEYARDRLRNRRDPTLVAFANMLTHRMMSLFYRAWTSGQPAPSFDRPGSDPFERKVAALAGLHGAKMRGRDAMPDLAKRYFAGHLGQEVKHAEGLMAIVSAFFGAKVEMQHFVGTWLRLEPYDRWQLGSRAGLGQATSIGERVWSRASKFRLRIGPLSLEEYRRLLPGGASLVRLEAIVRNYVGEVFDWDVNLVLRADAVPPAKLGENVALGHLGWIGTRSPDCNADELYLVPRSGDARTEVRQSEEKRGNAP